jgi:CheY-like chemotaxis protein
MLVADDHEGWLIAASALFKRAGAQVWTADSPEAAVRAMGVAFFDVVITDLDFGQDRMGGTRIYEMARELLPGCPVLALTGHQEAELELRSLGFDAVLMKPVEPAELVARVAAVLPRPTSATGSVS